MPRRSPFPEDDSPPSPYIEVQHKGDDVDSSLDGMEDDESPVSSTSGSSVSPSYHHYAHHQHYGYPGHHEMMSPNWSSQPCFQTPDQNSASTRRRNGSHSRRRSSSSRGRSRSARKQRASLDFADEQDESFSSPRFSISKQGKLSPVFTPLAATDSSSESSRDEQQFYSPRSRKSIVSPSPGERCRSKLGTVQVILWGMIAAAAFCSYGVISTLGHSNASGQKDAFLIDAPADMWTMTQERWKEISASGLRGKMSQGHTGASHSATKDASTDKKDDKKSHSTVQDRSKHLKTSAPQAKGNVSTNPTQAPSVATPPKWNSAPSKKQFKEQDTLMYQKASAKKRSAAPRFVSFDESSWGKTLPEVHRKMKVYPADYTDPTQLYGLLDSSDERLSTMERREYWDENKECVPMQEWQTTFHPHCNKVHEMAMNGLSDDGNQFNLFGTKGFWRNAWRMDVAGGSEEVDTVVLKTLKLNHNFEDAHFEHDRVDAVAMERLTASPHVINIFGFCGHSVITEFADGSRVGTLADKAKKTPLARLEIARDVASGLADVHGIDGKDKPTSFVHLDVNPANVVSIGGTLKLNDFNIGILRRWNTTSNKPCGFPTQYPNPQWRSPEEARNEQHLTEKVDVFSLGHIFFRLICGHEPWHKLEPGGRPSKEEVNEKVMRGVLPFIPEDIMTSKDEEIIAIRSAMLKCYTADPTKRPSSRQIAEYLDKALQKLKAQTVKQE